MPPDPESDTGHPAQPSRQCPRRLLDVRLGLHDFSGEFSGLCMNTVPIVIGISVAEGYCPIDPMRASRHGAVTQS